MDLSYILLKRKVDELNEGGKLEKPLIVDYYRNIKSLRIKYESYLLLKRGVDNQEWLNIGATYTMLDSECMIDFMTSCVNDYDIVRDSIRELFKGQSLVYYPKEVPDLELSYDVDEISAFLRKVNDVNDIVSENMFVKLSDGSSGRVVYKDKNKDCYVFLGMGQYMLMIISNMKDMSDVLKNQYRAIFEISMKVIKR